MGSDLNLVFDLDAPAISYGYFRCPECRSEFYGGSQALHKPGCRIVGYSGLDYIFGAKAAWTILGRGEDIGINPIRASDLRAAIPDIEQRLAAVAP